MSTEAVPASPLGPLATPALSRPKLRIAGWALWDWGSAAFNAVVTTFVFTVYLTGGDRFGSTDEASSWLGWSMTAAGVLVAVIAPAMGRRTDSTGGRKRWLGINTAVVVVCVALMFFVTPDQPGLPSLLWLGLLLLGVGTIFYEIATVNYNAMLNQITTKKNVGRVSGIGWASGYIGGIVLLLILYFGFINPAVGLFGVTSANGLNVRVSMLLAAVWLIIFSIPVLFSVPEPVPTGVAKKKIGFFASYAAIFREIAGLWRTSRHTVFFLIASAVFRDGLTGVFTFGGVLAAGSFGFSDGEVIIFAIAANIVAGVATLLIGLLDDVLGPKVIIVASLIGMIICAAFVFILHDGGQTVFWTFGLGLCIFVGPAQSASRSFLSRVIPQGQEGELFGLYATTGRAATFLAPLAFGIFIAIGGAQYWGIIGIGLVVLIGLVLFLPVHSDKKILAARDALAGPAA